MPWKIVSILRRGPGWLIYARLAPSSMADDRWYVVILASRERLINPTDPTVNRQLSPRALQYSALCPGPQKCDTGFTIVLSSWYLEGVFPVAHLWSALHKTNFHLTISLTTRVHGTQEDGRFSSSAPCWSDTSTRASNHYNDVIMSAMVSQITGVSIACSIVGSSEDQRKHKTPRHRPLWSPVNSQHKWPVTRKMFPFDDVIMCRLHRIRYYGS